MEYNPHAARLRELEHASADLGGKRADLAAELEWRRNFDRAAAKAVAGLAQETAKVARLALVPAEAEVEALDARTPALQRAARAGWDPRYWFSAERATHRRHLADHQGRRRAALEVVAGLRRTSEASAERLRDTNAEISRHDAIDVELAEDRIAELGRQLSQVEDQLAECRRAHDAAASSLAPLLAELGSIEARRRGLRDELRKLKDMEDRLEAGNSHDRRQVHEECERRFGDSSPRKLMRSRERQLQGVDRDVGKLRERLASRSRQLSRQVTEVFIDGNNLCYDGAGDLIGLRALVPLAKHLSGEHPVTVVFDPGITGLVHRTADRIRQCFGPGVRIHVASGAADATLLAVAEKPGAVVISNDRFGDFRDKAAVHEGRVFRHEIIGDRVLVHELGADLPLDVAQA
jgi:hypothetical protein